MLQIEVLLARG